MLRITLDAEMVAKELKIMRENDVRIQSIQDNGDGTKTIFTC